MGSQNGYGCTSTVRGYDPSGCHLHSHGVNEIHTNSECTQVPPVLKLEAMLSLPYPAYAVPFTRVSLHASPRVRSLPNASLIIHSHRHECRSSSHTQKPILHTQRGLQIVEPANQPAKFSLRLIPHVIKMPYDGHIRIQESIHTILRASFLVPIQLPASNRTRYAFLPANVGEGVDSCVEQASVIIQSFVPMAIEREPTYSEKFRARTNIVVSWLSGSH